MHNSVEEAIEWSGRQEHAQHIRLLGSRSEGAYSYGLDLFSRSSTFFMVNWFAMPLSKSKLIEAVKFLFQEEENITRMVVEALLTGKARMDFSEMVNIAEKLKNGNAVDLAREVVLVMEDWRLMLPFRTKRYRGTAWEDRLNTPRPEEIYEVPTCIAMAFRHLMSDGVWDWRLSIGH